MQGTEPNLPVGVVSLVNSGANLSQKFKFKFKFKFIRDLKTYTVK